MEELRFWLIWTFLQTSARVGGTLQTCGCCVVLARASSFAMVPLPLINLQQQPQNASTYQVKGSVLFLHVINLSFFIEMKIHITKPTILN